MAQKKTKLSYRSTRNIFNQYTKRRIFKCLPEFGPISEANHVKILVKLASQYDEYTGTEIKVFYYKLSEILHVSSQGILRPCRIDKGCFQLMFQVPTYVQQKIFPLSKEQKKALAAMGVIKLTRGEYQFLVKMFMFLFVYCKLWNEAVVVYLMW